jgi:hypothetical protein
MSDALTVKAVEQAVTESVQPRARAEGSGGGIALLSFLAQGAGLISPWWSQRRDAELARFWPTSTHVSGAFYTLQSKLSSVPFRIEPRDASIKAHRDMAERYQAVLEDESEFGQGWATCIGRFLIDYWSSDNGAFLEVIGDGKKDGPIVGPALGLAQLDASRCTRTGSVEYPVVYQATNGDYYRLHRSRVIYRSQMPSAREDMHGVGYSWCSRILDVAQNLVDIARYKQEKLGSRPQRGIIVTQGGLDPDVLAEAFRQAEHLQDARGLTRYSKFVVVGDPSYPNAALTMVDLASLPDGFDEQTSTTLAMYAIALTGAVPPRWLWPATVSGATKADAMYQHIAGLTGGPGATLAMIAQAIGGSERGKLGTTGKVLPPTLRMVFDFQDDEQDRTQAEIREIRSVTRERDLNAGVFSVRLAREKALEAGDVSDAQFEELELSDGRLPDGEPVLALFESHDGVTQGLLAVDAVGDPLDVENNDRDEWLAGIDKQIRLDTEIVMNAPNAPLKRKARQAVAALMALRELYAPKPKPPKVVVQAPPPAEEQPPEGDEPPGEESEIEQALGEEEPETGGEEADTEDERPFAEKAGEDAYGQAVRSAVRGLWSGALDKMAFIDSMLVTFERRLTAAWHKGAAECGIKPDELSTEELDELHTMIGEQMQYVYRFADDIVAGSKANGGKLEPLLTRSDMWSARYHDAYTRAKAMACGDGKAVWVLGETDLHCPSCLKLNGKVKRWSTWRDTVLPGIAGTNLLICQGYRCLCRLEDTDSPLSKGPLPGLP